MVLADNLVNRVLDDARRLLPKKDPGQRANQPENEDRPQGLCPAHASLESRPRILRPSRARAVPVASTASYMHVHNCVNTLSSLWLMVDGLWC